MTPFTNYYQILTFLHRTPLEFTSFRVDYLNYWLTLVDKLTSQTTYKRHLLDPIRPTYGIAPYLNIGGFIPLAFNLFPHSQVASSLLYYPWCLGRRFLLTDLRRLTYGAHQTRSGRTKVDSSVQQHSWFLPFSLLEDLFLPWMASFTPSLTLVLLSISWVLPLF